MGETGREAPGQGVGDVRKGVCEVYCLRRGDIAFFKKKRQLTANDRYEADAVEVRFRGSKGIKGGREGRGGVMVRTNNEGGWRGGRGGGRTGGERGVGEI